MQQRRLWQAAVCALVTCTWHTQASTERTLEARNRFSSEHPRVRWSTSDDGMGRITRVFGPAFSNGESPEDSAAQFVAAHSGMFGVPAGQLEPAGPIEGGSATLPLVCDAPSGACKFTLVYYTQQVDGIPVFRADLRLLVRNEPGFPLVLAASALRDLGDFTLPPEADGGAFDVQRAYDAAAALHPELVSFTTPSPVIWAGTDAIAAEPALALMFTADNGRPATGDFVKITFLADAATGVVLFEESRILHVDIVGNVTGLATLGQGPDNCEPEGALPMSYARVNVQGGNSAFADAAGDFVIPHGGNAQVTVQSPVRGQWFLVDNQGGADTVLSQSVVPPGPANFVHNSANNSEGIRAEVNGYVQANVVRDYTLHYAPSYPVIGSQQEFRVNVNIASTCNAYYDGSSINFYSSGGGCPNTAYSSVVHHEYGHHLVQVAGSGQGAYGEGLGDTMGVLILDDPGTGYGFFGNCSSPLRNADNAIQYPCGGEIHYCGQLLSGCVWHTRDALQLTNPATYRDIISTLTINSVPLHSGSGITPDITVDFLTLDDDDADITNGTPHYPEIDDGFSAHNMDPPRIETRCQHMRKFSARCRGDGTILAKVRMRGLENEGEPISFEIGGIRVDTAIQDGRAIAASCCWAGTRTVRLIDPADCKPDLSVTCE